MKKISFVFTLAITAFHFAAAQSSQSVYFELGGPGIASFNYDLRFSGKQKGIGARIGFGSSFDGNSVFYLPIGINYLIGKEKHFFEMGAGFTPVFGNKHPGDSAISESFGHLLFGYRFQPLMTESLSVHLYVRYLTAMISFRITRDYPLDTSSEVV